MAQPTYFTVVADYRAFIEDSSADSDYDQQNIPLGATVTFTPLINNGDVVRALNADPRPIGLIPAPVVGLIDPADGRLKLRSTPDSGGTGTFAPVRLLASTAFLELDGPLFYSVAFTNVVYANGRRGSIAGFTFEAPSADVELNLISATRAAGQPAGNIVKIAPGGVRLNDDGDVVFMFGSNDIPDPIPASALRGPQGNTGPTGAAATVAVGTVSTGNPGSSATVTNSGTSGAAVLNFTIPRGATGATGDAATIAVGTVSTGNPGSAATVTNTGTSGAAVFDFTIPRGDKGETGDTGPIGPAATIAVGTVTTGSPGSSATVTNVGTSGEAVFDITIPRGATGAQGPTGPQGIQGQAGVSLDINGTLPNYAAIIALSSPQAGDAYVNADDGLLYFFDGTEWPADGEGVPFVGPQGPTGPQGIQGPTGADSTVPGPTGPAGPANTLSIGTVASGEDADATITGSAPTQTLNLVLPVGPQGPQGEKGDRGEPGGSHSERVGDGTATQFIVTHNLDTRGVAVSVFDTGTWEQVECDVVASTVNTVTVSFATAPTVDQFLVAVVSGGTVGPEGPAGPAGPAGPVGATGATGATGAPGEVVGVAWWYGAGQPTTVVGSKPGDFYMDLTDGSVYKLGD